MARSNSRSGRNNNPSGRNQYSDWGVMEMARERPIAAAATAVGAAAAGLFLWSRRTQLSEQLNDLGERFGQWTESMRANGDGSDFEETGDTGRSSAARRPAARRKTASSEAGGTEAGSPG